MGAIRSYLNRSTMGAVQKDSKKQRVANQTLDAMQEQNMLIRGQMSGKPARGATLDPQVLATGRDALALYETWKRTRNQDRATATLDVVASALGLLLGTIDPD